MGIAVNASTFGMAGAGIVVALVGRHIDRRRGIWMSLALLAIPTTLLALTRDLTAFTGLRIAQGVLMASAFTLTMAYLSEHCAPAEVSGALAAYVTGNVASNLFGRLLSAGLADHFGISITFLVFAALNLAGAALVYVSLERTMPMTMARGTGMALARRGRDGRRRRPHARRARARVHRAVRLHRRVHLRELRAECGRALSPKPVGVGLVYLVFLPSVLTTPLAARFARRLGFATAMRAGFLVALAGLPLAAASHLPAVLAGLVLIAVGTFLAQAFATGYAAGSRWATAPPRAGSISRPTTSAASSAARCSGSSSTRWAGPPASP